MLSYFLGETYLYLCFKNYFTISELTFITRSHRNAILNLGAGAVRNSRRAGYRATAAGLGIAQTTSPKKNV